MVLRWSFVRSAYFIIIIYRMVYILLPQESDDSFSPPSYSGKRLFIVKFYRQTTTCVYVRALWYRTPMWRRSMIHEHR